MWFNGTGAPTGELVATQLQTLLELKGTMAQPVEDISITNIKFKDAAQTFMSPHGVPSCGDWALQRMAGVFVEGTVGTVVDGCTFERMDGNGLMMSKYDLSFSPTPIKSCNSQIKAESAQSFPFPNFDRDSVNLLFPVPSITKVGMAPQRGLEEPDLTLIILSYFCFVVFLLIILF